MASETILCQKREFSKSSEKHKEKQRFWTSEGSKNEPRWLRNSSETAPRSPKIALEPVLAALDRSWAALGLSPAALGRLLAPLGPLLARLDRAKAAPRAPALTRPQNNLKWGKGVLAMYFSRQGISTA